jgi:hypothetical protein
MVKDPWALGRYVLLARGVLVAYLLRGGFHLEPARRISDPFVTRTDMNGQFRFTDLTPGNYRVLSSFDYRLPDSQAMSIAGARPVKVDEGQDALQDLDLVVAANFVTLVRQG